MNQNSPIIIGGVGGSGTRLIAEILMDLGYHLGPELNESMENIWFSLLFKRIEVFNLSDQEFEESLNILITALSEKGRLSPSQIEMVKRISELKRNYANKNKFKLWADSLIGNVNKTPHQKWGWKEPNSHIILEKLRKFMPQMKYIHVIRNGLDMAFSENQNQLQLWGSHFLKEGFEINPKNSLKLWCIIHKKLLKINQAMKKDFYLLNFDDFCQSPHDGLENLSRFLGVEISKEKSKHIINLVKPLKSIGRFKQHDLSLFDENDMSYVKHLGFDIEKT